jgi:hypothetical protein
VGEDIADLNFLDGAGELVSCGESHALVVAGRACAMKHPHAPGHYVMKRTSKSA